MPELVQVPYFPGPSKVFTHVRHPEPRPLSEPMPEMPTPWDLPLQCHTQVAKYSTQLCNCGEVRWKACD